MRRQGWLGTLCAVGLVALGCTKGSDDAELFQADLQGGNEVPARPTAGSGVASFQVSGSTVHYTLLISGLDAITASHIHSGPATVNGPIRVDLAGAEVAVNKQIRVQGTFTAADVRPGFSFDQVLSEMRAGTAYVNAHTTRFPGGEVRGQVRLLPAD